MTVPSDLRTEYRKWTDDGQPPQEAFKWNSSSWKRQLEEYGEFFDSLHVTELNRDDVVAKAREANGGSGDVKTEDVAVKVFLLAMLWGYGKVGYGPYRTRRVLNEDSAVSELLEVARKAQCKGGLAAFQHIADKRKSGPYLKWLGPSFGTKYIYFLTAMMDNGTVETTPVMDAVVQRWFGHHAKDHSLRVDFWHVKSYETYLCFLKGWAKELPSDGSTLKVDDVEYLIFRSRNPYEPKSELSTAELFDQLRSQAPGSSNPEEALDLLGKLERLFGPSETEDEYAETESRIDE